MRPRRAGISARSRSLRPDERGAVVAEVALALPAVVLVLGLGVGMLGAAARHVRLQDAVADAARLAARGEDAQRVHAAVADAVRGASTGVEHRGELVCVTATASGLLALTVSATGCALAESPSVP
jgi:Flp pilus assembly protein TadG